MWRLGLRHVLKPALKPVLRVNQNMMGYHRFSGIRMFCSERGNTPSNTRKLGTGFYTPQTPTAGAGERRSISKIIGDSFYTQTLDLLNDPGRLLMNVGSLASLIAFAMQDVLMLRALSVTGSLCSIAYNATRTPFPQWNAVMWSFIFILVNMIMSYKLLTERKEITLTPDEDLLYKNYFEPSGVSVFSFVNLLKHATWKSAAPGEQIVAEDEYLNSVIMIYSGEAEAWDYSRDMPTKINDISNLIGATALVDPSVTEKPYPHRILAKRNVLYVEWNSDVLRAMMAQNSHLESAFLKLSYTGLIDSIRKQKQPKVDALQDKRMKVYVSLLETAVDDGVVHPMEKKVIREFAARHDITPRQHERALRAIGWSSDEWADGALHDAEVFTMRDKEDVKKLRELMRTV